MLWNNNRKRARIDNIYYSADNKINNFYQIDDRVSPDDVINDEADAIEREMLEVRRQLETEMEFVAVDTNKYQQQVGFGSAWWRHHQLEIICSLSMNNENSMKKNDIAPYYVINALLKHKLKKLVYKSS